MRLIIESPELEELIKREAAKEGHEPTQHATDLTVSYAGATIVTQVKTSTEDDKAVHLVQTFETLIAKLRELEAAGITMGMEVRIDTADEALAEFAREHVPSLRRAAAKQLREADPAYLLSLPLEERHRIMHAQVEEMAPLYNADLALPPAERELTAFTALDGVDPIREPDEYMRIDPDWERNGTVAHGPE
jgi:hypothetical protein